MAVSAANHAAHDNRKRQGVLTCKRASGQANPVKVCKSSRNSLAVSGGARLCRYDGIQLGQRLDHKAWQGLQQLGQAHGGSEYKGARLLWHPGVELGERLGDVAPV